MDRIKNTTNGIFKSVQDLAKFCESIQGLNYIESCEKGKKLGMRRQQVETLRTLLGFSRDFINRINPEIKKAFIAEAREGATAPELAAKYKLNYNLVCHTLHKNKIFNRVNDYWTDRKIMQLCQLIKSGVKNAEAARIMGIGKTVFQSMKFRIVNRRDCKRWEPIAEKMGLYEKPQKVA